MEMFGSSHIDWMGITAFVGALGTMFVAIIGAIVTAYTKIKTMQQQLMEEVQKNTAATYTSNGKSVGELAEAAETRRITRIPSDNRTDDEVHHIGEVPPPSRPGRDATEFLDQ